MFFYICFDTFFCLSFDTFLYVSLGTSIGFYSPFAIIGYISIDLGETGVFALGNGHSFFLGSL